MTIMFAAIFLPRDCADNQSSGSTGSGVYTMYSPVTCNLGFQKYPVAQTPLGGLVEERRGMRKDAEEKIKEARGKVMMR
jgi:hypothetical protein